jgi:hypothetical protein
MASPGDDGGDEGDGFKLVGRLGRDARLVPIARQSPIRKTAKCRATIHPSQAHSDSEFQYAQELADTPSTNTTNTTTADTPSDTPSLADDMGEVETAPPISIRRVDKRRLSLGAMEGEDGAIYKVQVLRVYKEGDHFGERSMLFGTPRSATVRTMTFCECSILYK